jgi:hypothetical protein
MESIEQLRREIRDCFTNYGVTEASISTMPDIIDDVLAIVVRERNGRTDREQAALEM